MKFPNSECEAQEAWGIRNYRVVVLNQFIIKMIRTTGQLLILFLLMSNYFSGASDGDERESFIQCVSACSTNSASSQESCQLDSVLRWSGWSCLSDCKYRCMRLDVSNIRTQAGKIVQYYGKWPFVRVGGAQELFSVLFSLGNFFACIYGYFFIYRSSIKKNSASSWMGRVHFVCLLITANTWLQSAIFHYRDTPVTEKLDYFSACLCILSTLPSALIRVLKVKNGPKQFFYFALPVLVLYLQHTAYMSFVLFDYGYNIKFNAVFGISTNLVWLYYAIFKLTAKSSKTAQLKSMILKFVAMNVASMAMVAIDFPPLFDLIDMHALWHLSTIPITIYWYKLITLDHQFLFKSHKKD